jgi:undecaprenyl-diphosphatase
MPRSLVTVAAIASALFAALLGLVAGRAEPVVRFDAAVSAASLTFALEHPAWRAAMLAVTSTGGPTVIVVATVAAVAALAGRGRVRDAAFVAVAVLGATGLRLVVLAAVARPRPAARLTPVAGWSFPSGHTTASAVAALAAVVVAWPLLRRGWPRGVFTAAALGWAALVGVSRVALVVHWPSDVLGAWLMVVPVVIAASRLRTPFPSESIHRNRLRFPRPRRAHPAD